MTTLIKTKSKPQPPPTTSSLIPDPIQWKRIEKARVGIVLDDKFFGSRLMQVKVQEADKLRKELLKVPLIQDYSIPTFATDGTKIIYNPAYCATLNNHRIKGVLLHELYHIVFLHSWRRDNRDPMGWNAAADYVINLNLIDQITKLSQRGQTAGYELPPGCLVDEKYRGLCEEQVYALLPKSWKDGSGQGPDGYGGGGAGQVLDAPGNPTQRQESLAKAKLDNANAQALARQYGSMPAGLDRTIDDLTAPRIDWKQRLMEFVARTIKDDYSYRRPRSAWLSQDIILPSLDGEGCGEIVVIVDTSGSINDRILSTFSSELSSIHADVKPSKLTVIYADADIAGVDEFLPDDEFRLNPRGGGGTDFRPAFDYIADHGIQPECVIYLTDGEGTFPDEAPPYPVLWVLTQPNEVPFGDSVEIYEEDER